MNYVQNSTERRKVQEKTIMEGNQNLCLIFFFFVFSVHNSLEKFVSSNLFDLNNVVVETL
jgi:hypothetical protein